MALSTCLVVGRLQGLFEVWNKTDTYIRLEITNKYLFISCGFFSVKCCLKLEMKQRDVHKLQLTDKYLLFISCGFFLVKCSAQQMCFTKSDRRFKVCLHLVSAHPSLRQHQGETLQLLCQCPLVMTVTPFTVRVLFVPQLVQILMFLFLFLFLLLLLLSWFCWLFCLSHV